MSGLLQKARQYEKEANLRITPQERPVFHLTPPCGWMNDPNGFSLYGGKYHLFFQYNPYSMHWDTMYWGHAESSDLLHWEYLPAALAPDRDYDEAGCFSGNAIELDDGRQLLMYTGVRREKQSDGEMRDVQVQCLAVGDGRDYQKTEGNPVIAAEKLPAGASRHDFRDPKLWRRQDGTYCCAVASRAADGSGQILLYTSKDAFSWDFWKVLAANKHRYGRMWECPDFFTLDGTAVLLVSPQDMLSDGEFHSGNASLCILGNFDEATGAFTERSVQPVDSGIDFYAMQTVLAADGRRIMLGWMQNWDSCTIREDGQWATQMSLPRELFIRNERLCQKPVKELEKLRQVAASCSNLSFCGSKCLEGLKGRAVDMEITIRPALEGEPFHSFRIRFADNGTFYTDIVYYAHEHKLRIDRSHSGSHRALLHTQDCTVLSKAEELHLRLVLDIYSAELFINGGEQAMSAVFYTDRSADSISFHADGTARIDVCAYTLDKAC